MAADDVRNKHYMSVISDGGPLIIVRVPFPMPRWRSILKALTPVMREHGKRQRDIFTLDGILPLPDSPAGDEDPHLAERLDRAFDGDDQYVRKFKLYDWHKDAFILVREACS